MTETIREEILTMLRDMRYDVLEDAGSMVLGSDGLDLESLAVAEEHDQARAEPSSSMLPGPGTVARRTATSPGEHGRETMNLPRRVARAWPCSRQLAATRPVPAEPG
jgi:hypothetical protein